MRHKMAVLSLCILFWLYLVAILAPFFAPNSISFRDQDFAYCPPQIPKWSFSDGWYTYAVKQNIDPITLKNTYSLNRESRIPLGFFVEGDSYSFLGLFSTNRHFFGVDKDALTSASGKASQTRPVFFLAGTDRYGRDIMSRLIFGSRISLSIGLIAIFFTFLLGVSIGGLSGYVGGRTDLIVQRLIEVLNSFPHIPLWLAIGAILPQKWTSLQVYLAITLLLSFLNWTNLARVVRGKILSLREEDYAVAARLLGASHGRILFRHLMPGFASHIIVTLTLSVPTMILGETALSFLGLGLRPPIVSWGVMLQECLNLQIIANYPWLLMPVVNIIVTVLCFNFLGDGIRDAADPYAER